MLDRTALFRSVTGAESDSIESLGRFSNPPRVEVKYFATTLAGAEDYARLAGIAYGKGRSRSSRRVSVPR